MSMKQWRNENWQGKIDETGKEPAPAPFCPQQTLTSIHRELNPRTRACVGKMHKSNANAGGIYSYHCALN
jgi:hypothetical protein